MRQSSMRCRTKSALWRQSSIFYHSGLFRLIVLVTLPQTFHEPRQVEPRAHCRRRPASLNQYGAAPEPTARFFSSCFSRSNDLSALLLTCSCVMVGAGLGESAAHPTILATPIPIDTTTMQYPIPLPSHVFFGIISSLIIISDSPCVSYHPYL